jgi:hypothetical protein
MIRTSAVLAGALMAAAPAMAGSADVWMGRYEPVSRACRGLTLTIVPGLLSFGDCSRVSFAELPMDAGFAARIDARAKCALAGKVLTLSPSAADGNTLSTFDTDAARRNGLPNLVCSYSR